MLDVMKHKLVGSRIIPSGVVAFLKTEELRGVARERHADRLAHETGRLIVERWPPSVTTTDEGERLELAVFVFSPAELAQLIADVRDKAIEETMALADTLIDTPQES